MKGIRAKLLRAFLVVVIGLSATTAILMTVNYQVVRQYRALSDTMIAEFRLIDSLSELILAYNARAISTDVNEERTDAELAKSRATVAALTTYLDAAIVNPQSKVTYIGLKNSIVLVTDTIDRSVQRISKGGISDFTEDYYEVNRRYQFVRENGTALLFEELEYASSLLDRMNRTYFLSQVFGVAIFLLIFATVVAYVIRFSGKLTNPLLILQQFSLQLAAGRRNVRVDAAVLKRKDEVGSLARSFQMMTDKLAASAAREKESQHQLEERAADLERMNKLMVGRELKMIELKRELDRQRGSG